MRLILFLQFLSMLLVLGLAANALSLWYSTYIVGQYYLVASPFAVLVGGLFPLIVIMIVGFVLWKFCTTSFGASNV